MSELIGREFKVLDHGHVILLDYMGCDDDIAEHARNSYKGGTKRVSSNNTLLRYLMRHRHTSPFELATLKFHIKLPIFVERQWARHRTFSWNEVSARYSVLPEEVYTPSEDRIAEQSKTNKQGSGSQVSPSLAQTFQDFISGDMATCFETYRWANSMGIARELARLPLPVATYTEKVWCGNLHNLLHFLELRLEEHAQWEIRQYAELIADIVAELFPITWQAFMDYRLEAVTFSRVEQICLSQMFQGASYWDDTAKKLLSPREQTEFFDKIDRIRDINREQPHEVRS